MTDRMNDDELLKAFFADNQMEDIPDDGFSDKVMEQIPSSSQFWLQRLWTAVCITIGVVAAIVCQGWEQIQEWFYSMKLDFALSCSHFLVNHLDGWVHTQNLWMLLAGAAVLFVVWGYNVVLDSQNRY